MTQPNLYFITNSACLKFSGLLAALSCHQCLGLLSVWYQRNFVKSFGWLQRPLLQPAEDERSGCFSNREENRAKSATNTLFCVVIQVYLDLTKSVWTSLLILLFWTEEADIAGNNVEQNWNRNALHKIHTLTNQDKSPPRLWKAKLSNSQQVWCFVLATCFPQL